MNLSAWFIDSISVEPLAGRDGSGDLIYGAAVDVACRVEDSVKVFKDRIGAEVMSSRVIATTAAINADDRITLTGSAKSYTPIAIKRARNKNGSSNLVEVYI